MANYVNNEEFYNLLVEYRETRSKKCYEKIGAIFLLIAKNFLNRSNLIKYTSDRKEVMISDATYYMCRYIDKYDLTRKNPHAYFSMITRNACLQFINEQKKRDNFFTNIDYIDSCNREYNGTSDFIEESGVDFE